MIENEGSQCDVEIFVEKKQEIKSWLNSVSIVQMEWKFEDILQLYVS